MLDKISSIDNLEKALKRVNELEKELSKLQQSENTLIHKAIIDESPIGISVRDKFGNLLFCNQKWIDIWHMPEERVQESLKRKMTSLNLDKRDKYLDKNSQAVVDIYHHGGDLILTNIFLQKLNIWVDQRFYSIKNIANEVTSVVILTEEVTARVQSKLVEKELRETTQKYKTLVRNLPVAAFTTDFEGYLVSANPAMQKMFRADSEESLYEIPVYKRYKNPSARDSFLVELRNNHSLKNYETELVREDGSSFWASISANATFKRNSDSFFIDGIIRDITASKALEAEMIKTQKLESIGVLAGGIAHNYNNIMAAILGNITLAKLYIPESSKAQEKLDEAEKASLRASGLTKQLLTFSKGGLPVKELVDIKEVLLEAASFASTGSKVKVNFVLQDDLWHTRIDEGQISQVIHNLVINGIQAIENTGSIEIQCENALINSHTSFSLSEGHYLQIEVSDTGVGIDSDIINEIFDPYFTTKSGGHGLGLATVYSIINNHDGQISVSSVVGKGTTFTILLPATLETMEIAVENTNKLSSPGQKIARILLMDDEVGVLEVAEEILTHFGFSVDTASNGEDAVNMYIASIHQRNKYDLLIMDITVQGGMGGAEALQEILKHDPCAKAVVASGYASNTIMSNFEDFGFVGAMAKPFDLETLLSTVRKAIASSV